VKAVRKLRPHFSSAILFVGLFFLLLTSLPLHAVEPSELLSDTALEARARALSRELRCMVCQNESIDDSAAPLAHDLRVLVRERVKAGDSDAQILDFLVARYGEFVLLRPRLAWHTALLWGLPPATLLLGAVAIVIVIVRRQRITASEEMANLTPAEEGRLSDLLREER